MLSEVAMTALSSVEIWPHRSRPGLLGGEHALGESQVSGHREGEDRRQRHDAQAADDDARRDDSLPEGGPIRCCVHPS